MKLGRGERRVRGVKPSLRRYPSSAAGFRRRALFFEVVATRQIRAPTTNSGHFALARLSLWSAQAPTSPGPWERTIRNNHAYGISCRTRPIPIVRTRSDIPRNRYRVGRFSHRSLQLGRDKRHEPFYKERCDRRRARPEKWPDLGPVDYGRDCSQTARRPI